MSDPVLDTIDNVLHDYEVSGDAMRWTPEPAPQPGLSPADVYASMVRVATVMQDAQEKLRRAFANMAKSINKLHAEFQRLTTARREAEAQIRRSAMHSEYHRRQKRRNRR